MYRDADTFWKVAGHGCDKCRKDFSWCKCWEVIFSFFAPYSFASVENLIRDQEHNRKKV